MKWIKRIGFLLVGLFILINTMAFFHAWQFSHFYPDAPKMDLKTLNVGQKLKILFFGYQFPKSTITAYPSIQFDTLMVRSVNGLKISGWLLKNDSTPHAVILFHGHGGNKGSLVGQAEYFYSLGFSTLTIDFRAHGESDGTTCTVGYEESEEVKLAFDFMEQEGYQDIALYGTSLGAVAIIKSIRDYKLSASKLILEMPFASLPDAVKGRMKIIGLPPTPFSQMLTFWGGVQQGYWAFNFSPCEYSSAITCPVLLQWGDQDVRVQQHEIQCIYDNIPGNKKLVVYEGAGHQALYRFDSIKWEKEIKDFLVD